MTAVTPGRDELREALKPFAKIAEDYEASEQRRIRTHTDLPDSHRVSIALGDCRNARLALDSAPPQPAPDAMRTRAACDWPVDQVFTFADDPGEHDPCYVVMPGGAMLPVNHHAGEGVDIARAKFIVQACNAALTSPMPNFNRCPVCGINNDSPFPCEHAPVPPADGAKYRWLNDLIKAAEAFRVAVIYSRALDKVPQDQFIDQLRSLESALNPLNYRALPSGAGAAEPVAYRHAVLEPGDRAPTVLLSSSQDNPWQDWLVDHLDGCKYTCEPLYALPPVRGDREATFMPVPGEREILRAVWADIEFAATNAATDDYHGDISDETVAKLSALLFPKRAK